MILIFFGGPFFWVAKIRFAAGPVSSTLLCFRAVTPVCFSKLGACWPSSTVGNTLNMDKYNPTSKHPNYPFNCAHSTFRTATHNITCSTFLSGYILIRKVNSSQKGNYSTAEQHYGVDKTQVACLASTHECTNWRENISSLANRSASPLHFVPVKASVQELWNTMHNLKAAIYYT